VSFCGIDPKTRAGVRTQKRGTTWMRTAASLSSAVRAADGPALVSLVTPAAACKILPRHPEEEEPPTPPVAGAPALATSEHSVLVVEVEVPVTAAPVLEMTGGSVAAATGRSGGGVPVRSTTEV
jgi:hypothetical protein